MKSLVLFAALLIGASQAQALTYPLPALEGPNAVDQVLLGRIDSQDLRSAEVLGLLSEQEAIFDETLKSLLMVLAYGADASAEIMKIESSQLQPVYQKLDQKGLAPIRVSIDQYVEMLQMAGSSCGWEVNQIREGKTIEFKNKSGVLLGYLSLEAAETVAKSPDNDLVAKLRKQNDGLIFLSVTGPHTDEDTTASASFNPIGSGYMDGIYGVNLAQSIEEPNMIDVALASVQGKTAKAKYTNRQRLHGHCSFQ